MAGPERLALPLLPPLRRAADFVVADCASATIIVPCLVSLYPVHNLILAQTVKRIHGEATQAVVNTTSRYFCCAEIVQ